MRQLTLNDPVVELDSGFKICLDCGSVIPKQVVICWNCGVCLDHRIKRLAEVS